MDKDELIEFLKENMTVHLEASVVPFYGPEIRIEIKIGDELICEHSGSVSTSWLKSDGEYY